MRMPEFTAEASLGRSSENYTLASQRSREIGGVLPQSARVIHGSGYDIIVIDYQGFVAMINVPQQT